MFIIRLHRYANGALSECAYSKSAIFCIVTFYCYVINSMCFCMCLLLIIVLQLR